jgi:hypothetical protein
MNSLVLISDRLCQVGFQPLLPQSMEDFFPLNPATHQSEQGRPGTCQMDLAGSGIQKLTPVMVHPREER